MIKILGPFIYADFVIDANTKGANDAEKTEYAFSSLLSEIEKNGSCVDDVIAVQKYVTPAYDNPSTRDAYSIYFKRIMPSLTAVTFENLTSMGCEKNALCKILVVAVKGCSKGDKYEGIKLDRVVYPSGAPLESVIGYSRAVKAGPFVFVGGTTSVLPDKSVYGSRDSKLQDEFIWQKITDFSKKAGALVDDTVKVKKFVTPEYKSSGSMMPVEGCISPLTETVLVKNLNRPDQIEETELCAIIGISEGCVPKEFASFFDAL